MTAKIIDVIPSRENTSAGRVDDKSQISANTVSDYLILKDENGKIIARSEAHGFDEWIHFSYNDLLFVAPPGYNHPIFITWESLVKFVKGKS